MTEPSKQQQVIYALSLLSNISCKNPGITDADLLTETEKELTALKPVIGQWDVVWGPSVATLPDSDVGINTMYVAKKAGEEQYVVAIAGTNPASSFDWILQDFNVVVQCPWVFSNAVPDSKISAATALGLVILNHMKPGAGAQSAGVTLLTFLKSINSNPLNLTVTGHSKGGPLSATLALMLRDLQGIPLLWDPRNNVTVTTMPTGGPSAGNAAFAEHSNNQLPYAPLDSGSPASFRFANSLDIVTKAWELQSLDTIKSLYAPEIPDNKVINGLVDFAKELAARGDYMQIAPADPQFTGSINTEIIDPEQTVFKNFLEQALYQHVTAYLYYFFPFLDVNSTLNELLPMPSQPVVSAKVKQLIEAHGGKVCDEAKIENEPVILPIVGNVTDPSTHDKAVEVITGELKKLAS